MPPSPSLLNILMKYIFLILLFCGCAAPKFYPEGYMGTAVPYIYNIEYDQSIHCRKCGKVPVFFKVDKKKRILCKECYEKYYK